jgi:hypothetical protein
MSFLQEIVLHEIREYLTGIWLSFYYFFFNLFLFFLLEQKETKIQGERPTPIYPAESSQNGGSHSFAKISRTITNVCRNVKNIFL